MHCLDTLSYILGDNVQSVHSFLSPTPTLTSTERTASLSLEFSRGSVGSIACSFEGPTRHIFIEVIGTEGLARSYDFTLSEYQTTLEVIRRVEDPTPVRESVDIQIPNLYTEEVTAFSQCILDDLPPPVPGTEGWRNQLVLDAAMKGGGEISYS